MFEELKKGLTLSFLELKLKNNNTRLGFLWYFLQPLFMFLILFYVKHVVVEADIKNFIPYLLLGVIIVHFFISSTNLMMNAMISNQNILNSKKVNPKIFLFSKFFVSFWNHLFEIGIAMLILFALGYFQSLLYILVVPLYSLFIFGVGSILCVISTKFFDITYIWNYFCQILWFITPVYYLANENILIRYNPLVYFIDFSRFLVYDLQSISLDLIFECLIISILAFLIGKFAFERNKDFII